MYDSHANKPQIPAHTWRMASVLCVSTKKPHIMRKRAIYPHTRPQKSDMYVSHAKKPQIPAHTRRVACVLCASATRARGMCGARGPRAL